MPNRNGQHQTIQTAIESIEAKARVRRSGLEELEDRIVAVFGTIEFLIINMTFFAMWVILNSGLIPDIKPFDPFPYFFFVMLVSLEAIVLAIFVLITQNRQERVNSLREETSLQVGLIAEQETTKILKILAVMLKKMGVDARQDPELQEMLQTLNPEEIEQELEEQLKNK